jgi:uncharacterized membrane protein
MIGMLQIITYLLCVYLVFKGFEILQVALASSKEDRGAIILIGILAVAVAFLAALYFVHAIDAQAAAVGTHSGG